MIQLGEEESFYYDIKYFHQINNPSVELGRKLNPNPPRNINPNDPPPLPIPKKYITGSSQCSITCLIMLWNYWIKRFLPNATTFSNSNIPALYSQYDSNYLSGNYTVSSFEFMGVATPYSIGWIALSKLIFTSKGLDINNFEFIQRNRGVRLQELYDILYDFGPIIVCTKLTKAGHYILIIGYNADEKSFYVHDPYYKYNFIKNKYDDTTSQGNLALYPEDKLYAKLTEWTKSTSFSDGVRCFYIKSLVTPPPFPEE